MGLTGEYIRERIAGGGVVGAGGAGFPTHVKLTRPVEIVIANGAECEPLLAGDSTLMQRQAAKIIRGLSLAMEAVRAKKGFIAFKKKHRPLPGIFSPLIKNYQGVSLFLLDDFYPAGDEQTLINEVTGRRVRAGELPFTVGVTVNNVATLYQVAEAFEGSPVTSRYVTVTGAVREPRVFDAPLGTPVENLLAGAGGATVRDCKVIIGGPMMGRVAEDYRRETTAKTVSGVVVLPHGHWLVRRAGIDPLQQLKRARAACDGCRMCTDLCPRYLLGHPLEPHATVHAVSWQRDDLPRHICSALLCCQCGVCDIIACPCHLSPRALYLALRRELNGRDFSLPPFGTGPAAPERLQRRTPLSKVLQRLALAEYARYKFTGPAAPVFPERVRIKLKQHVGAPAAPLVQRGDRVKRGQLIAAVPRGKLGAAVHASISGIVGGVDREAVEITRFE